MQKKQDEKMTNTQFVQENGGRLLEDDKLEGVVGGLSWNDFDSLLAGGTAKCPKCDDGILHMIDSYDAKCDHCECIVAVNAKPVELLDPLQGLCI